jgi:neutral trehalase
MYFYDSEGKDRKDHLQLVKYESGWDNSARWDNGIIEYWAIDLNCFMVLAFRSLKYIAKELGLKDDIREWEKREKELSSLILERCYDKENGYFADVNRFTGEISKELSPASFMPLYVGIVTLDQAKSMQDIAIEKFKGKMPTVPFDSEKYSNDYWRGPTWLNVAYFAGKGLKDYGFKVGDEIKEWILNACYKEKGGIYENYNSVTGKGLCCDHFSWSSVFIIEFILNW